MRKSRVLHSLNPNLPTVKPQAPAAKQQEAASDVQVFTALYTMLAPNKVLSCCETAVEPSDAAAECVPACRSATTRASWTAGSESGPGLTACCWTRCPGAACLQLHITHRASLILTAGRQGGRPQAAQDQRERGGRLRADRGRLDGGDQRALEVSLARCCTASTSYMLCARRRAAEPQPASSSVLPFKPLVKQASQSKPAAPKPVEPGPELVLDHFLEKILRPHQVEGVRFLYDSVVGRTDAIYTGAILADDMGMGCAVAL